MIARGGHDFFNAVLPANIAGINAKTGRARFGRFDAAFIMKMDIRDQRHADLAHDVVHGLGALGVRDGHAHNICAGLFKAADLRNCRGDIRRQGVGHGLHSDWRVAAHWDIADHDLSAFTALYVAPRPYVFYSHKQGVARARVSLKTKRRPKCAQVGALIGASAATPF